MPTHVVHQMSVYQLIEREQPTLMTKIVDYQPKERQHHPKFDHDYQKMLIDLGIDPTQRMPYREYIYLRTMYFVQKKATDHELDCIQKEIDKRNSERINTSPLVVNAGKSPTEETEEDDDVLRDPLTDS